jgi:hypothetical protein
MKKLLIFSITLILLSLTLSLIGCGDNTSGRELLPELEIKPNHFDFKEMRVYESFGFKTSLGITLNPYLSDYIIDDQIEIVITKLQFTNTTFEHYTWMAGMIILIYKDNIFGALTPYGHMLRNWPGAPENIDYGYNDGQFDNTVHKSYMTFDSNNFLSKNQIVSHIDKELIFSFEFLHYLDDQIELKVSKAKQFSPDIKETQSSISITDIYHLDNDIAISLVNQTIVDYIEFEAVVTKCVPSEYILVDCEQFPTLKKIAIENSPITTKGKPLYEIKVGRRVQLYIFLRYPDYQPTEIYIYRVIVK